MKTFVTDFFTGIRTYWDAIQLIEKEKLWHFFLYPLVFTAMMAYGMYLVRGAAFDFIVQDVLGGFFELIKYESWWSWLQELTDWIIYAGVFIVSWYLFFKLQKYIVLVLLSPVLAYVSEKTEEALTGQKYAFEWRQFFKDILRGSLIALLNLGYELFFTAVLFVLSFIPVLTPFTIITGLLVGWYYFGYSTMDYWNERKKLTIAESNRSIKDRRGIAIANGMVFEIIFAIPIFGFIVAPILATVAGTVAMSER